MTTDIYICSECLEELREKIEEFTLVDIEKFMASKKEKKTSINIDDLNEMLINTAE